MTSIQRITVTAGSVVGVSIPQTGGAIILQCSGMGGNLRIGTDESQTADNMQYFELQSGAVIRLNFLNLPSQIWVGGDGVLEAYLEVWVL